MTFQLSASATDIYEQVLVPLWFANWADALIDLAKPRPGETILDAACGTGVTTRRAKAAVGADGTVIGLDINDAMPATAARLADGIEIAWQKSDVAALDLPDDTVDAIFLQHGWHYFPEKPATLREFRRVLRPGGRLLMSIWTGHSAYTQALCTAVARHISAETAAVQSAQRKTPTAQELEKELIAADFADVRVVRQELEIRVPPPEQFVPLHLASMPIADAFSTLPEPDKAALIADVSAELTHFIADGELVYTDAVHVMTGIA